MNDKIFKLDITDDKMINRFSYNPAIYYCGNHSNQKMYSGVMKSLEKKGVAFPFNRACFKHDMLYAEKPTLSEKIKIDYEFYKDMNKLLDSFEGNYPRRWLKLRMMFYYFVVILATPVYIFQGKVKND